MCSDGRGFSYCSSPPESCLECAVARPNRELDLYSRKLCFQLALRANIQHPLFKGVLWQPIACTSSSNKSAQALSLRQYPFSSKHLDASPRISYTCKQPPGLVQGTTRPQHLSRALHSMSTLLASEILQAGLGKRNGYGICIQRRRFVQIKGTVLSLKT